MITEAGERVIRSAAGEVWIKIGPGDNDWINASVLQSHALPLLRIVEALRFAIVEMDGKTFPWEKNAVAGRWLEHEIRPLLEAALDPANVKICQALGAIAIEQYRTHTDAALTMFPIGDNAPILPGQQTMIIVLNQQHHAVRPQRLVLAPEVARVFQIDDLKISNKSQFLSSGSIPGTHFEERPGYRASPRLKMDTWQTLADLVLFATYTGTEPAGEPFHALLLCSSPLPPYGPVVSLRRVGDIVGTAAVDPPE